jgi:hypothetical protein
VPTTGVSSVVTTQFRSMMRLDTVVAGNVNWGYSSTKEWTNVYGCTGASVGAFCYSTLGCARAAAGSQPRAVLRVGCSALPN